MLLFRDCFGRGSLLGHRGNCSEPINLEVFVPHKRPGGEAGGDERELGQLV